MSPIDYSKHANGDYAPAWRPDPGDVIEGEVVRAEEGGLGDERHPIWTIRRDDGSEAAVHGWHAMLVARCAELDVQEGARVRIAFDGKFKDERGRTPARYRVELLNGDVAPEPKGFVFE
jgi:hypothetical protein